MQVESFMACQPAFDRSVLMTAIVVDDQVHVELVGNVSRNQPEKVQELLTAVKRPALREYLSVGDVQRRKQCCGPVATIIVGVSLHVSQAQR